MSLFSNIPSTGSVIFKNEDALDPEWVPKLLPYRELQQHQIANCIKPLLQSRNGRNIFIFGEPGIGKTAATKWVTRDLEETSDDVVILYVNCWQKNTTFKVFLEICHQIGYSFTQNKNTEDLFEIIKGIVNKKQAVFVFDEVDKVEDTDFLYSILNDIFKKSIILITNYKEWLSDLEDRVRSRLLPESIEFKEYSRDETKEILKQRIEYAFVSNAIDQESLVLIAEKTFELKDVRVGLFLLRESGLYAEQSNSRKIIKEHASKAIERLAEFKTKDKEDLENESRLVLDVVKENTGKKIGELFDAYKQKGGTGIYKTFQRRIEKLEQGKFISVEKIQGGKEGNTTKVNYTKNLNEY